MSKDDVLPADVVDTWRARWADAQRDAAWVERHQVLDAKRRKVLPEIEELVRRFMAGEIEIDTFREVFDRKTRNEWDLFGLKGLSGAMFLNKLVKHLPEHNEAATALRGAVRAPANELAAREQIEQLGAYLDRQVESGVATVFELQANRSSFFLSACWHVQQPDQWPITFQTARKALKADGLLRGGLKGADKYLDFRRVFGGLASLLGISFWDLEHLCVRVAADMSKTEEPEGPTGQEDEAPQRERIWLVAPGRRAQLFDEFYREGIIAIGFGSLGDLSRFDDVDAVRTAIQQTRPGDSNPIHDALAGYQFAHEMKVGDVIFAKRGRREIVGYGVITSEYRHEPQRSGYTHVRSVEWKKRGEWVARDRPLVTKTLTEIGKYPTLVAQIRRALQIEPDSGEPPAPRPVPVYGLDDAVEDLFLSRAQVEEALELLRYKKNLVLQGPPGVGKTFFARRLAYLLLGQKDPDRISLVQFHQSYAYEDFVQGYRPVDDGKFARVDGPFMTFCDRALQDPDLPYVLVIDEINRGNLSKIFGELLLLIEADKRSETWAATLTYAKAEETPFYVPANIHIIGTMNTADRSLAMVDYALRRRFAFLSVPPGFDQTSFAHSLAAMGVDGALRGRIVARLASLNAAIREDVNLGEGFCVGHSYFCHKGGGFADEGWYKRIVRTEIEPLLREYWFDNAERAAEAVARLLDDD